MLRSASILGGAVLMLGAIEAKAFPNTFPSGARASVEVGDLIEPVHCRRYRHGHRDGRGWSSGCHVGVVVAPSRWSVIRKRDRFAYPRTTIRAPNMTPQTTTRSGDRPSGVNT